MTFNVNATKLSLNAISASRPQNPNKNFKAISKYINNYENKEG